MTQSKDKPNSAQGAGVTLPPEEHRDVQHVAQSLMFLGCRITVHWSPELKRYRYRIEGRANDYGCGWYLSPQIAIDLAKRRINGRTKNLGLVSEHEAIRRIEAIATEEGVPAGQRLCDIEDACRSVLRNAVNAHE